MLTCTCASWFWGRGCRGREAGKAVGRWKGSGLQSAQTLPNLTLVSHPPSYQQDSGERRGCVSAGGKMSQNSRKRTYFLFCNSTDGTHPPGPPRSSCTRKQKFCGSPGTCERTDRSAQQSHSRDSKLDCRLCLLLLLCAYSPQDRRRQPANKLLARGRHLFIQIYYLKAFRGGKVI